MEMTDTDALRRYADRRDPEAFAALVERYQQMVYTVCLRCLNNHEADARDATQDTFVKLARSAGLIRGNLVGWLHRCAKTSAIDLVRSESRRRKRETQTPPRHAVSGSHAGSSPAAAGYSGAHSAGYAGGFSGDYSGGGGDPEWTEVRAALDEALDEMPERYRALIVQRYLAERSQQDLAEEYGVSQSMISRKLSKAVDVLRQKLKARGFAVGAVALTAGMSAEAQLPTPTGLGGWPNMVGVAGLSGPTATTWAGGWLGTTTAKLAAAAAVTGGAVALGAAVYFSDAGGGAASGPSAASPDVAQQATGSANADGSDTLALAGEDNGEEAALQPTGLPRALEGTWILRAAASESGATGHVIGAWAHGSRLQIDRNTFVWRAADGSLLYRGQVESVTIRGREFWQETAVEVGDPRAQDAVRRRPFFLQQPGITAGQASFGLPWDAAGVDAFRFYRVD